MVPSFSPLRTRKLSRRTGTVFNAAFAATAAVPTPRGSAPGSSSLLRLARERDEAEAGRQCLLLECEGFEDGCGEEETTPCTSRRP